MVEKILGRMEVLKGFIQVPAKNKNELIGDMSVPCKTLVNGQMARIDNYGRIWSPVLKGRFPEGSRVELIKTEEGFQVVPVESASTEVVLMRATKRDEAEKNQILRPLETGKLRKGTTTSKFGSSKREGHDSTPFYNSKLYKGMEISEKKLEIENPVPFEVLDRVLCQDARKMNNIPDSSVHLMVTSPPYNVGKEYDEDLNLQEYLNLLKDVFSETYRVLVVGGRVCVNIANVGRKPYIPYHKFIIDAMLEAGFLMRGEIIWNKAAGAGSSTAWGSWCSASNPTLRDTHEYILVFSKGKFSRNGKNKESTISKDEFLEFTKSVWEFQPESARKVGHPAPFPVQLPYRCIQLYTFKDEVVLDPFCGVGTSAIAAISAKRHYVCLDDNSEYVEKAKQRINDYLAQVKMSEYVQIEKVA